MRILPAGARWVLAMGALLAAIGALQGQTAAILSGLGVIAGATVAWGIWIRSRLNRLRRWLQSREGSIALQGENAWDTLESELRYYFKQRDHQLRDTRRRLSELEGLAQELPVGVALVDSEGRLLEANPKAYELLAMGPAEAREQKLQSWLREPGLRDLFASEGPAIRRGAAPYRPDPSRTLSFTCTRKDDGSFLLVMEEITERVRLQQIREDFVANVSHELKSPLTSLRGFAETLLGDPDLPAERRQEFLQIMGDQIGRMQTLVGDLLTLSRLEARPRGISATPIPLDTLLSGLHDQFAGPAREKGIELSFPSSDELKDLTTYGEADALAQALGNLVDNALKYTPGDGTVEITTEHRPSRSEIAVSIRDSGIGIEAHHIPRLTERFYRVDKGRSRAVGGTGLGLSIVKHILHHHGGRLEVTSRPGGGSTFTAVLPDQPPEPARAA